MEPPEETPAATSEREKVLSTFSLSAMNDNFNAKRRKTAVSAAPQRTSMQLTWEEQYENAWKQLQEVRNNVERLRKEHIRLTDEASNIRLETHEYMNYMEKKTSKRQNMIVSLNDQNQKEIEKIKEEERQITEEFERQKDELRDKILTKETQLANTQLELNNLEEYRELQQKQSDRIAELQGQVAKMQVEHSETIQQLKAQFLDEKKAFEEESEATISALAKQAKKEASDCLNKHTENIKKENREMRQELMDLIERTRALHLHKIKLEKQKKELTRELQYNEDVKIIRHGRRRGRAGMNRRGNAESESSEEEEDTNDDRDSIFAGITTDHSKGNVQHQQLQQQQQQQRADQDSTNNNSGETRVTNPALASRLHITNKSLK